MAETPRTENINKLTNNSIFPDIHGLIQQLSEKLYSTQPDPTCITSKLKEKKKNVNDINGFTKNSDDKTELIPEINKSAANQNNEDSCAPEVIAVNETKKALKNEIIETKPTDTKDVFDISTEKDYENISLTPKKVIQEKDNEHPRSKPKQTTAQKLALRALVKSLVLRRHKRFYCSECAFTSKHHFSFYSHCKHVHLKLNLVANADEPGQLVKSSEKNLYYCGLCTFVSFMANGMKIHSSVKHPDSPAADFDNCVSVLDPRAEKYYRTYIETIENARQYKRALQQLKYYFPERLSDDFEVDRRPLLCMLCSVKQTTPNDLLQHYLKDHGTKGPKRNKVNHLFHCEKCLHTSISYRVIHHHFAAEHNVLDSFKQDNLPEAESTDDEAGNDEEVRGEFSSDPEIEEDFFTSSHTTPNAKSGGDIFESFLKASENKEGKMLAGKEHSEKQNSEINFKGNKIEFKRRLQHAKYHKSKLRKYSDITLLSDCEDSAEEAVLSSTGSGYIRPSPDYDHLDASPDLDRVVKCDKCAFATSEIKSLINHWKGSHNRLYPKFVVDKVVEYYKQNSLSVVIPKSDVNVRWVNGYMNAECTGVIQNPVFMCNLCDFKSPYLNTVYNHYASKHPSILCSASTLQIEESDPVVIDDWKSRTNSCITSQMFKCKFCPYVFASYYYRNMAEHLTTKHAYEFKKEDLDRTIRGSVVYRCTKCDCQFHNIPHYLRHVELTHKKDLVNFTVNQFNEFQCELCADSFSDENSLFSHLSDHSFIQELPCNKVLVYCCSVCRRAFRAERFMRHHFTRMHVEWTDKSFTFNDIPSLYHFKKNNESKGPTFIEKELQKNDISLTSQPAIRNDSARKIDDKPFRIIYTCPMCTFSSHQIRGIRIHLKKAHGQNYTDLSILPNKIPKTPVLAEYITMDNDMESSRNNKIFTKCSHDKWKNASPNIYAEHIKWRHFQGRAKKCPQCSNYYCCAVIRQMHITRKHSKRPKAPPKLSYRCNNRTNFGYNKEETNKHVEEMHRVYDPYSCPHCSLLCMCGSVMYQHLRKRHEYTEEQIKSYKELKEQKELKSTTILQEDQDEKSSFKVIMLPRIDGVSKKREKCKDYSTKKSVQIQPGQWKCLFCKMLLPSYLLLRKHILKTHDGVKIVKCRWCDFITKDGIKLAEHQKIHQVFVAQMMKQLRQIWKAKRLQALEKANADNKITEQPEGTGYLGSTQRHSERLFEKVAETIPATPKKQIQTARKSLKYSKSSISPTKRSDSTTALDFETESSNIEQSFTLASNGKLLCNFCPFEATDKLRILLHLKGNHVQFKTHQCQLCYFKCTEFQNISSHLATYHKMERNHHLAIKVLFQFSEHNYYEINDRPVLPGFEPQPSLPTAFPLQNPDVANNSFRHLISETNQPKTLEKIVVNGYTANNIANSISRNSFNEPRRTRSCRKDKVNFCKYCNVKTSSTYEMEIHLKRHEVGTLGTTSFTESDFIFSQFF